MLALLQQASTPYLKPESPHRRFGVPDAFERVIAFGFLDAGDSGGPVVVLHDYYVVGLAEGRLADGWLVDGRLTDGRVADVEPVGFRYQRWISADDSLLPRQGIAERQQNAEYAQRQTGPEQHRNRTDNFR